MRKYFIHYSFSLYVNFSKSLLQIMTFELLIVIFLKLFDSCSELTD